MSDNDLSTDHAGSRESAMERLRDRTDELELIISSLTIFALFSLPGLIFGWFADSYMHLSTSQVIASTLVVTLLSGFCYGLGVCFVVHLMARGYWVGLIGLRSAFPNGINWDRTPTLGPHSRDHYRKTLPRLDQLIENTDRLASSLFAVISMLTLLALWYLVIMLVTLVPAGVIGAQFGMTNTGMVAASLLLLFLFFVVPLLLYVLDAQVGARITSLENSRMYGLLLSTLRRLSNTVYPSRLLLPVQLTLQSNTRPVMFFVALFLGTLAIVLGGNFRFAAWQNFTVSPEFTYLNEVAVREGFHSTYYEDMAASMDRLRGAPRIDSFVQSGSHVRLFLPYQPLRDNLVLDEVCTDPDERATPGACLRRLWSVKLAGQEFSMDQFTVAQRADIGMRGLIGVLPLGGLAPGLQQIEVEWNAGLIEDVRALDERYSERNFRYVIPIAFSPAVELPLEQSR